MMINLIRFNNLISKMCFVDSCLGTFVAQGMCCCFKCCCQQVSQFFAKWLGPQKVTKLYYLFLVAIFTIPAIIVLFLINQWDGFTTYFSWLNCPVDSGGNQLDCVGPSAIYRMSLSVLCLFGLMLLVTLTRSRCAMIMNQGLFCIKYVFVLALFIGFLWVNNQVFINFSNVSIYLSIIFMVIQSIILIDLFYLAGIKLVARYDQGQTSFAGVLIGLSILFEAAAITLNVLGYVFFSSPDSCGNTLWVNVINSIILIILPILQLLNFNKQNSLLTTSLVGMYISYLSFICQFSYGGSTCTERMNIPAFASDVAVSTAFFILTMYGSIMGGSGQVKINQKTDLHAALGVVATDRGQLENGKINQNMIVNQQKRADEFSQTANLAVYTQSWEWVKWHFYMCLASLYIGMLVTNWTSASLTTGQLHSNQFGFWVRVVMSWATAFLYIWTLIAPKLFPNRDFTVV